MAFRFLGSIDEDKAAVIEQAPERFMIGIPGARLSWKDFREEDGRVIDTRACDAFSPEDTDWGEQDSLENIPRTKQPAWVRALSLKDDE